MTCKIRRLLDRDPFEKTETLDIPATHLPRSGDWVDFGHGDELVAAVTRRYNTHGKKATLKHVEIMTEPA